LSWGRENCHKRTWSAKRVGRRWNMSRHWTEQDGMTLQII
jgi:hypothetical protein